MKKLLLLILFPNRFWRLFAFWWVILHLTLLFISTVFCDLSIKNEMRSDYQHPSYLTDTTWCSFHQYQTFFISNTIQEKHPTSFNNYIPFTKEFGKNIELWPFVDYKSNGYDGYWNLKGDGAYRLREKASEAIQKTGGNSIKIPTKCKTVSLHVYKYYGVLNQYGVEDCMIYLLIFILFRLIYYLIHQVIPQLIKLLLTFYSKINKK